MIKKEIEILIQTLTDQLKNFDKVSDDRLEAFLDLCVDNRDNYSDERIQTRELKVLLMCMEADVRNPDNIGHCGERNDYVWDDGKWMMDEEQESDQG
jgi:hypothetical protein